MMLIRRLEISGTVTKVEFSNMDFTNDYKIQWITVEE